MSGGRESSPVILVSKGWIEERNCRIVTHGRAFSAGLKVSDLVISNFQQGLPPLSSQLIHQI